MEKKMFGIKGQVNVVVLVLIILIVLIGIVIVWNVVIPIIREKSEDVETSSLIIDLEIKEVILFVDGVSKITVNRKSGKGEISKLNFVFQNKDGESFVRSSSEVIKELETKTYSFSGISNFGEIEKVSVVPVVGEKLGREFSSEVNEIFEVPLDLVSWWRFEGDGGDFAGNNNGNLIGSVSIDSDSGELVLNGGHLDVGNDSSLSISNKIAIGFWIKPDADNIEGKVISKGNLNKNYEISLTSNNEINFSFTNNGGLNSKSSNFQLVDGVWTHIFITGSWSGNFYIYKNGEFNSFASFSGSPDLNDLNVLIGQGFKGRIDELMIFNNNLDNNQVKGLYNNFKKG